MPHDPAPAIAGLILAGGAARRMGGGDKGLTQVGGRAILERTVDVLRPQVARLGLSANGDPTRFQSLDLPILPDLPHTAGPLAGILTGLHWAAECGCPWLLTVPTDTPFLPGDLALRLWHGLNGGLAAMAASGGRGHPVAGLWSVELAPRMARFWAETGEQRAQSWANACDAVVVEWPDSPQDPFFNVNTPQDRERAETLAAHPPRRPGIVVMPAHESAERLLSDFTAHMRARGLRLGGLLQQRTPDGDATMLCLETGQTHTIMQKLGRDACCAVDPHVFATAAAALRRSIDNRPDLLIVNKFGHLEAEGDGIADEMMAALAEDIPLLTTVSAKRLPDWLRFCGGHSQVLPPEPDALVRWWDSNFQPLCRRAASDTGQPLI